MNLRQFVFLPLLLVTCVAVIYYAMDVIPTQYDKSVLKSWVLRAGMLSLILYYSFIKPQYGLVGVFVWIVCAQIYHMKHELSYKKANDQYYRRIDAEIQELNSLEKVPTTSIPKHIVQIWVDNGTKKDIPLKYQRYMDQIREMHPDYQYLFFNGPDIDLFFKNHYPEYYTTYLRLPVFIQKVDFFRYLAIYHYGGFYMDIDIEMQKPLDDAIRNHSAVFPIDEYIEDLRCSQSRFEPICEKRLQFLLGQYMFAASPRHPFIKHLVDNIHENIDLYIQLHKEDPTSDIYVYRTTGPDFVSYLYSDYTAKNQMYILSNGKRQMFGDYAEHQYYGSWKTGTD